MARPRLRLGWRILLQAVEDVLDRRFTEYALSEQDRRYEILLRELGRRQLDKMPKKVNAQLIRKVAQAATRMARLTAPQAEIYPWPAEAYRYILNHGGKRAIKKIVNNDTRLIRHRCGCGEDNILVCKSDAVLADMLMFGRPSVLLLRVGDGIDEEGDQGLDGPPTVGRSPRVEVRDTSVPHASANGHSNAPTSTPPIMPTSEMPSNGHAAAE